MSEFGFHSQLVLGIVVTESIDLGRLATPRKLTHSLVKVGSLVGCLQCRLKVQKWWRSLALFLTWVCGMILGTNLKKHMVERPIKKSERPAKDTTNDTDNSTSQPSEQQRADRSTHNKDRDRDRGRGGRGSKQEEPRSAGSPALMRGPKPVKAKPPVVEEVQAEVETEQAEDSQESTSETPTEVLTE
jgi:hypothetical protein